MSPDDSRLRSAPPYNNAVSGSAHYVRCTEARRLMGAAPETSERYLKARTRRLGGGPYS